MRFYTRRGGSAQVTDGVSAEPTGMQLDTELRETLWQTRHWESVLRERAASLRREVASAELAAPARALAEALEAFVLDRTPGVEMHLLASKASGGDPGALARAREGALEVGDLGLAARIAAMERKHGSGDSALAEGELWLDAGQPDRAIRPLLKASRAVPGDEALKRALAAARHEWADVRGEIDRVQAAAASGDDGAQAARDALHASRIARMLGEGQRVRELAVLACRRDPTSERACAVAERELTKEGDANALLELYRRRCDAVSSAGEVVDTLRRAVARLSLWANAPGLAVNVAVRALSYAYEEGVRAIPGHIALIQVVYHHYTRARAAEKALLIVDHGLAADVPDDDRIALAIVGLEVAWGHLGAAATAQRYAGLVEERAPRWPGLDDFARGRGGLAPGLPTRVTASSEPDGIPLRDAGALGDEVPAGPPPGGADAPTGAGAGKEGAGNTAEPALELDIGYQLEGEPGLTRDAGSEVHAQRFEHANPIELPADSPAAGENRPSADSRGPGQFTPPEAIDLPPQEPIDLPPDALVEIEEDDSSSGATESVRDKAASTRGEPRPGPGSLIPGAARKALEHIVHAPANPPSREAEKRAEPRMALPADAAVPVTASVALGGGGVRAVTRDVSPSGAFIVTEAPLPQGAAFEVTLAMPTPDGIGATKHALRAVVVREEPGVGYGVRFEEPGDDYQRAVSALLDRQRG